MPHEKRKQGGTKRRTQKENPREKPQTKRGRNIQTIYTGIK